MEKIYAVLNELLEINSDHGISTDALEKMQDEMAEAKVCTPVIGVFSSGKSALINALLGYQYQFLNVDITPETAIPTEITYTNAEEDVIVTYHDGTVKNMSVQDYRKFTADANTVRNARIKLHHSVLSKMPDVMIVDMPGFESGLEIHNKAIDDYLPQSMAYVITFPADDMIVRSSVGTILKELCLHDVPLCVVITKCDKKDEEFDGTFENLKKDLRRYIGTREIRYCMTSSLDGEVDELLDFLLEIQENARMLLAEKYKHALLPIAENTESYLNMVLNGATLSESELAEKEEELQRKLASLDAEFSSEKKDFDLELAQCVEEIKGDIQGALEAEESALVSMVLNNQGIKERLNAIVRNAVTLSVKNRLLPKLDKYLNKVMQTINGENLGDVNVSFYYDVEGLNKDMVTAGVAAAGAAVLGFPIVGIVIGIVALISKLIQNRKREEAKEQIRAKLRTEVYPKILNDVGHNVEFELTKKIKLLNESVEKDLASQRDTLTKAVDELRQNIQEEQAAKDDLKAKTTEAIKRIEEIKNELR